MSDPVLDFGKYQGLHISDVPSGYLQWCLRELKRLEPHLRAAMRDELEYRRTGRTSEAGGKAQPPPTVIDAVITQWHRQLCLRWHPDRGGDVQVMAAINDAVDKLRTMLAIPG